MMIFEAENFTKNINMLESPSVVALSDYIKTRAIDDVSNINQLIKIALGDDTEKINVIIAQIIDDGILDVSAINSLMTFINKKKLLASVQSGDSFVMCKFSCFTDTELFKGLDNLSFYDCSLINAIVPADSKISGFCNTSKNMYVYDDVKKEYDCTPIEKKNYNKISKEDRKSFFKNNVFRDKMVKQMMKQEKL